MRALGFPVARYKFVCFVIGGMLAGLAGHLYVILTASPTPRSSTGCIRRSC